MPSAKKSHYFVTINLRPDSAMTNDELYVRMKDYLKSHCVKWILAKEIGDNGKEHCHCAMELNVAVRLDAFRLALSRTFHVEPRRPELDVSPTKGMNPGKALLRHAVVYCCKDNDYEYAGYQKAELETAVLSDMIEQEVRDTMKLVDKTQWCVRYEALRREWVSQYGELRIDNERIYRRMIIEQGLVPGFASVGMRMAIADWRVQPHNNEYAHKVFEFIGDLRMTKSDVAALRA